MNKLFSVAAFAFALAAQAEVYTVQTDEILPITDATVGDYAGGIAFKDNTGVVTFDTSSAPTMNITGAGTVKKISTATWVLSKHIPNFTGAYELTAGTTIFCPPKSSGCDYLGDVNSGGIYVRAGADLHLLAYNGDGGAADA